MRGLALAAVAVLLALPMGAAAEHAYSHRYLVYGRVIDAEGRPLVALPVNATLPGREAPPCRGTEEVRTDGQGEFAACFHVHELNGGRWNLTVGGQHRSGDLDLDLRKTRIDVRLAEARPDMRPHVDFLDAGYRLTVIVWSPGNTTVEGVPVRGNAHSGVPVTITFRPDTGPPETLTLRTDSYGDARFSIRRDDAFRGGTVRVEGPNATVVEAALDVAFHASTVVLRVGPRGAGPDADPTGTGTNGTPGPGALAALALLGGLALAGRRRA